MENKAKKTQKVYLFLNKHKKRKTSNEKGKKKKQEFFFLN